MTLATADADGAPWASPVWFAHEQYETFLWMSRPGARHSRNIAARREIAIVIFDSTVSPHQRNAVYVEAAAAIVPDAELADAVAVYAARSVARGDVEISTVDYDFPSCLHAILARCPWRRQRRARFPDRETSAKPPCLTQSAGLACDGFHQ